MPITSSANPRSLVTSLVRAYVISIAIHVLVLGSAAPTWRDAVPSAPLVVSLRPSTAAVAPPEPAVAALAVRQRAKPVAAEQKAIVSGRTETRKADPVSNADTVTETANAVTGSESDAAPAAPDPRPAVASALPPVAGIDAEGLRRFRLALAREIRRYKRYPAHAEQAGWAGTVVLRVKFALVGPPAVELEKTSGYPELDDAALEMLRRALPATSLPASLRERAFSVDLPVVFELPE